MSEREAKYGLPHGGDWTSWQAGRKWARENEYYAIPRWCHVPGLRVFVMVNALAAPVLLIVGGFLWGSHDLG